MVTPSITHSARLGRLRLASKRLSRERLLTIRARFDPTRATKAAVRAAASTVPALSSHT